ncbi:hypothetical protein GCM10011496_07620 [Polaromonas eurypsychrophila]|uniref:Uncharacterized protein n=1 Tax=Polaromonas eurypsychrophila TaxID=1614635 RepID=A0A916SA51_9BURK|nr:hypothetical protein GCM10011496_07620 [Polaromonas eurypsychrophila]
MNGGRAAKLARIPFTDCLPGECPHCVAHKAVARPARRGLPGDPPFHIGMAEDVISIGPKARPFLKFGYMQQQHSFPAMTTDNKQASLGLAGMRVFLACIGVGPRSDALAP